MSLLQVASLYTVGIWIFFFLILLQRSPKQAGGYKTKHFKIKMATVCTIITGPSMVTWGLTADAKGEIAWYALSIIVPLTSFLIFRTKTANEIAEQFIDKRDL